MTDHLINCAICNHQLYKQEIACNYEVNGWDKKDKQPNMFDYYSCQNCFDHSDGYNHFSISYLGDKLWTLNVEKEPEFYLFNNYLADRCMIDTYDADGRSKNKIYIESSIKIDMFDLKKMKETILSYVIFT